MPRLFNLAYCLDKYFPGWGKIITGPMPRRDPSPHQNETLDWLKEQTSEELLKVETKLGYYAMWQQSGEWWFKDEADGQKYFLDSKTRMWVMYFGIWTNIKTSFSLSLHFYDFSCKTKWELNKIKRTVGSIINKLSRETYDRLAAIICDYLTTESYVPHVAEAYVAKALGEDAIFVHDMVADLAALMCKTVPRPTAALLAASSRPALVAVPLVLGVPVGLGWLKLQTRLKRDGRLDQLPGQ